MNLFLGQINIIRTLKWPKRPKSVAKKNVNHDVIYIVNHSVYMHLCSAMTVRDIRPCFKIAYGTFNWKHTVCCI